MNFSVGFADEIEKLALRLPSPQEMLGAAASGQVSKGVPQLDPAPAPAPAAAPPQVNVHVHHQAPKTGAGGGKKALPKPPQDAPSPIKHSTEPENLPMKPGGYQTSAEVGAQTAMPKAPAFSGGTQKPLHSYSSQMKDYVDEGTGPTKQHYVDPSALVRDTRKFDAPKTPFTNISMGDVMSGTTGDLRNPMAGLAEKPRAGARPVPEQAPRGSTPRGAVAGPGSSEPAPTKGAPSRQMVTQPVSAAGQNFELQQIPLARPKKMFGTGLASGAGPTKI